MKLKLSLIIILTALMSFSVFAQSDDFSINVVVNYLEFSLEYMAGGQYVAWWIAEIAPNDTIATTYDEFVRFTNLSNSPIDLYCDARDFPDSSTADSLWEPWNIGIATDVDVFSLKWAGYTEPPVLPDIDGASFVLNTPILISPNVPPDAIRYLCGWFLAPSEALEGERHRLQVRWTISPVIGD